jgi:hypothetical protein
MRLALDIGFDTRRFEERVAVVKKVTKLGREVTSFPRVIPAAKRLRMPARAVSMLEMSRHGRFDNRYSRRFHNAARKPTLAPSGYRGGGNKRYLADWPRPLTRPSNLSEIRPQGADILSCGRAT